MPVLRCQARSVRMPITPGRNARIAVTYSGGWSMSSHVYAAPINRMMIMDGRARRLDCCIEMLIRSSMADIPRHMNLFQDPVILYT